MMRRLNPGDPITAKWANEITDFINKFRIANVVGGFLTRNSTGGMTLNISQPRNAATRARGDADILENTETNTAPESKSIESKDGHGRFFSFFNFKSPPPFSLPEDKSKYKMLVRDGSGNVPELVYVKLEELEGAMLPDGEKDKDVLLWDYDKKEWKPARTETQDVVVNVVFENGILRQQKKKVRVIQETEGDPTYSTIITFQECEGYNA